MTALKQESSTLGNSVISEAKEVLRKEADALIHLADTLDADFDAAVDTLMLADGEGRIIVTGMGKSGHIGAKIAATMASLGTPAFMVHPGEASHGDLGMITNKDVVLALSHSGETKELADTLAYCSRYKVPLVSITKTKTSTLGRSSTVCLSNGVTAEACPLNIAPTSSTTATLALGDALAVAMMKRRQFKPEDFAVFHPGGKLGSRLSTVAQLMAQGKDMPLVHVGVKMDEALLEMTDKRLGLVGVLNDEEELVGIVTDGDLRRHMSVDVMLKDVKDVMTHNPLTITAEKLAVEAVSYMQDKGITSLVVMKDEDSLTPVGVIHIHDCLKAGVA